MKIAKTSIEKIKTLRTNYFKSLPEFQELFLEIMIETSDIYLLELNDTTIGYFIINREEVLIEFYVLDPFLSFSEKLFDLVLKEMTIKEVYCKSFDALLLTNCMLKKMNYSVYGVMFRDYIEPGIQKDMEITLKKSNLDSVHLFKAQDGSIKELFETDQQLHDFIQNEDVFEFYKNNQFVGCGMIIRTHAEWNYCDLGVWVHPEQRGKSYGTQIILNLREFAIDKKLIPSCGCAIDNIASQRTIEKSGYVSKHKMIRFQLAMNNEQ